VDGVMRMRTILLGIASALAAAAAAAGPPPRVVVARLENEAITPVTAQFLERCLDHAAARDAECLVIVLDTPGGLVESTRQVVKAVLASDVPVVVYVAPPGARAASAGVFVTMAAHVAAMAPGTNIGAAHPVTLGGLPVEPPRRDTDPTDRAAPPPGSAERDKAVNDTVAWARSLAELRGRSAGWVERAVRESVAVPSGEAVAEGAVDLVAADLAELLAALDGREVRLPTGPRTLRTAAATIDEETMWWGERMLAVLASPNLAILLLVLGFYGVLFEFYSPGWGVAGTLGAICLALSFFSLAVLPVRFVGLLLVLLALVMFAAEAFVTSYGALAAGGVVCLLLGGLMLVESPAGFVGVSLTVLLPFALATAAITFLLVASVVRSHRGRVRTGAEACLGAAAVAAADFEPVAVSAGDGGPPGPDDHGGTVRLHGEFWRASSAGPVAAGTPLEVVGRDGLVLRVRPAPVPSRASPPDPGETLPCHPA
jgi:membrane-bound serine protease (ClpP class)